MTPTTLAIALFAGIIGIPFGDGRDVTGISGGTVAPFGNGSDGTGISGSTVAPFGSGISSSTGSASRPKYTNPILYSDYSDPDVCAVNGEYWMTSSSFNCVPGLQILHSNDLVNWDIVGAALPRLEVFDGCTSPRHGEGVWAPSIRYHDGLFYIFWGDPDRGIYEVHTEDPRGEWSAAHLLLEGKGIIDACPLWDEDGRVYVVHGWAASRAGFNSVLTVRELKKDLSGVKGPGVLVFDGLSSGNITVEGPKFYKRNGWYYIFAPAGGVPEGWQLVMRSRNIYGPYESRVVLHKGGVDTHGPHQGGWVDDTAGNSWFLHFEDRGPWGRVVHLQPMQWGPDDWCTMGIDINGDGIGEPVASHSGPAGFTGHRKGTLRQGNGGQTCHRAVDALETSSGFSEAVRPGQIPQIPLNWQWHAGPSDNWAMLRPETGSLHMNCIPHEPRWRNLWDTGNLLLEKIVGPSMELCSEFTFTPLVEGERCGIVVMGMDYSTIEMRYSDGKTRLEQVVCKDAHKGSEEIPASRAKEEIIVTQMPSVEPTYSQHSAVPASFRIHLKVTIDPEAVCRFYYSHDGKSFKQVGSEFQAREGRWIGAKIGFFATAPCEPIVQKNGLSLTKRLKHGVVEIR